MTTIMVREDMAARLEALAAARGASLEGLVESRLETWLAHEEATRPGKPSLPQKLEALLYAAEALRLALPGSAPDCTCSGRPCPQHLNAWGLLRKSEALLDRALREMAYAGMEKWQLDSIALRKGESTLPRQWKICLVVESRHGVRIFNFGPGEPHASAKQAKVARDAVRYLLREGWELFGVREDKGWVSYFFRADWHSKRTYGEMIGEYEP